MRITIKDIARKSGVSSSTVSRVLTNHPSVDPKTREEVQKVIDRLGYRPSHIARGLVKGKIDIVALIIGDIRNPFYAELTRTIKEFLNKEGYMVVVCDSDYDPDKEEAYIRTADVYGFAGIIMITAMETETLLKQLKTINCPVVLLNRYLPSIETDFISVDNYTGGYLAGKHLLDLGHRNIAILAGHKNSSATYDRLNGFLDVFKQYNVNIDKERIVYGNLQWDSGYNFGKLLLNQYKDATAVFCGNDLMAIGLIEALNEYGKRVPEDFSIVGYDNNNIAPIVKLTTIHQPHLELGQAAAEVLLERMRGYKGAYKRIIFNPKLIVRKSTVSLI
ncbi:LacI family DNA-binding transcriptional regulator [Moorella sp. Hama-1]|uniref:LacI family DNA-binding transcriptional regulator n=1 Tax=Moorella sp. Hama-1 TaxID=2138101 RepID=UPI000D65570E|nr:LacI family DNA-binding transcriptional regulator [Moorella sp. Hama-1]BCV21401.1 LacI family transcriptional regulator [Moorella sp. Hama-1]